MTTTNQPKTIKAEVGENFFDIVDRLFDNTARTVCVELIQNARRAGATKITFKTDAVDGFEGIAVTVTDNGCGIQDMAELLRIRSSGWDDGVKRREDPAGMGFFCLSRMKSLSVRSGTSEAFMGANCEALRGRIEVPVEDLEEPVEGTELSFLWPDMKTSDLRTALIEVGEHAPISIALDDTRIRQSPFRPNDVLDEFETDDCKVYIHERAYNPTVQINFHGLVVEEETTHRIHKYAAKIDIKETSALQMVLPARNAMVRNKAFKHLMGEIRRHMYRLLAALPSHRLPYSQWQDAELLNVSLQPARPSLVPHDGNEPVDLPTDVQCCIMRHTNTRGKFESVAAAMAASGRYKLFKADQTMEGYPWYDALAMVTEAQFIVNEELLDRPGTVGTAKGMLLNVCLDWADEPIDGGLPAPVFIGRLPYAEDEYNKAIERSGGFLIDMSFGLSEDDLSMLIDSAWKPVYLSDNKMDEWNRLRDLDIRKCVVGAEDALEYAIKAAIRTALGKMSHLTDYAGSEIKISCYVGEDGEVAIDRF